MSFDSQGLLLGDTLTSLVLITDSSQNCVYCMKCYSLPGHRGLWFSWKTISLCVVLKQHLSLSSFPLISDLNCFISGVFPLLVCTLATSSWRYGLICRGLHIALYASSILPKQRSRMCDEWIGQMTYCCRVGRYATKKKVFESPIRNSGRSVDCASALL